MKYLQLCTILFVIGSSLLQIQSLPIETQYQAAASLPDYIKSDLPVATHNPQKSVPLSLLDVENADKSSVDAAKEFQRSARGIGLGGFGDFGGLGGKFGGLGSGFKGLGGLGSWGLGGLHGLGLGGYKPFFGKYFG